MVPFHVSLPCASLAAAREFYIDILGLKERRATPTSIHLDASGHQLTLHEIPGHSPKNFHREVDTQPIPIPHFGFAVSEKTFWLLVHRLRAQGVPFFAEPQLRFPGQPHEQWSFFVLDPSGNGVEVKHFIRVPDGEWA